MIAEPPFAVATGQCSKHKRDLAALGRRGAYHRSDTGQTTIKGPGSERSSRGRQLIVGPIGLRCGQAIAHPGGPIMHPVLRPKNLLIGALGAAVVGLGTVVVVDRTAAAAPATHAAPNSPPSANLASLNVSSLLAAGEFGSASTFKGSQALNVFNFFTTDTKLTWQQVGADLLKGETLDQIAGANASKVEKDALAEVRAGLTLG